MKTDAQILADFVERERVNLACELDRVEAALNGLRSSLERPSVAEARRLFAAATIVVHRTSVLVTALDSMEA